jgi:transcriptional regulator with XRE-family HTH domain
MGKGEFGVVLREVRTGLHMTQRQLAAALGRRPMAVNRWEMGAMVPRLEDRLRVLHALDDAPRADLERLAIAAGTTLRAAGFEDEPAPPPAAAPSAAPLAPPPPSTLSPLAQAMVDDAVREAAEDLEVAPQKLRPALSRMLDRIARAGVPIEAATRMVLGVPKRVGKA